MLGLSLTQPWATLVAIGAKKIETRSWATAHRGPIAIHAAKGFPAHARLLCYEPVFSDLLDRAGYRTAVSLPLGAIVAVANLVRCEPTWVRDSPHPDSPEPGTREYLLGDYESRRYMFLLEDIRKLEEPVACRGALNLWPVPAEIEALLSPFHLEESPHVP